MPKGIYIRTNEHNRNISKSTKERYENPKERRKTSDSLIGRKFSAEHKRKLSKSAKRRGKDPEERKKMSEAQKKRFENPEELKKISGEKGSNWKGDSAISYEIYPREFNNRLKKEIRKRDNNTCQLCGRIKKPNSNKLSVHHINYNKKNNNPKNLITLCHSCNAETKCDKKVWIRIFQNMIKKIYKGKEAL